MTDLLDSLSPEDRVAYDALQQAFKAAPLTAETKITRGTNPSKRAKINALRAAQTAAELASLPVTKTAAKRVRKAAQTLPAVLPTPPELTERQLQVVQLRNAGLSQYDIAAMLDISQPAVAQILQRARAAGAMSDRESAVSAELNVLEKARDRCIALLDRKYFKVSAGVIVRDQVEGPDGLPLKHPVTGDPIMARVEDVDTILAIVDRIDRVSTSIAQLKGHRAPKQSELVVKDTRPQLPWQSPEAMEAMLLRVAEESHRRRRGLPPVDPVVDVEFKEVRDGDQA